MISRDIYAKVSGKKADVGSFYISFTFTPPVEAGLLSQTLSQALNTFKREQGTGNREQGTGNSLTVKSP
jgi:hypothetical protein